MAFRTWARIMLAALGVGALAGASQLGVAYGLGLVRLTRVFDVTARDQWTAQLAWVAWFAMVAAVIGALVGGGLVPRWRPPAEPVGTDPLDDGSTSGTSPARAPELTVGSMLGLAASAAVGAAIVVPLTMQPARTAQVAGADPALVIGICAALGAVLGAFAAYAALAHAVSRWNIAALISAVWVIAVVSVVPSLGLSDQLPSVRLGVFDAGFLSPATTQRTALFTMPALALLAGAALGWVARRQERSTVTIALAGLPGPAMLTLAYLIAGPGEGVQRYQVVPYWAAMTATGAGVLGSVLAAVIRRGEDLDDDPAADATTAQGPAGKPTDAAGPGAHGGPGAHDGSGAHSTSGPHGGPGSHGGPGDTGEPPDDTTAGPGGPGERDTAGAAIGSRKPGGGRMSGLFGRGRKDAAPVTPDEEPTAPVHPGRPPLPRRATGPAETTATAVRPDPGGRPDPSGRPDRPGHPAAVPAAVAAAMGAVGSHDRPGSGRPEPGTDHGSARASTAAAPSRPDPFDPELNRPGTFAEPSSPADTGSLRRPSGNLADRFNPRPQAPSAAPSAAPAAAPAAASFTAAPATAAPIPVAEAPAARATTAPAPPAAPYVPPPALPPFPPEAVRQPPAPPSRAGGRLGRGLGAIGLGRSKNADPAAADPADAYRPDHGNTESDRGRDDEHRGDRDEYRTDRYGFHPDEMDLRRADLSGPNWRNPDWQRGTTRTDQPRGDRAPAEPPRGGPEARPAFSDVPRERPGMFGGAPRDARTPFAEPPVASRDPYVAPTPVTSSAPFAAQPRVVTSAPPVPHQVSSPLPQPSPVSPPLSTSPLAADRPGTAPGDGLPEPVAEGRRSGKGGQLRKKDEEYVDWVSGLGGD